MFRFVEEKEGLGFPRGGGGARRPLRGRGRAGDARTRAPRRRGSGGRGSGSCSSGRRSSTQPTCGSRRRRRRRASTWRRGASARRCCGRSGSGYAPSAWDQVLTRGQRAGFSVAELRGGRAGPEGADRAATTTASGRGSCSRCATRAGGCRGSARGRCGRDAKPKYLNSPEGELYRKSRTLYGIDRARAAIAQGGAGGGGRGLHGRARRPPGGDRGGGGGDGDGDHAGAAAAAARATRRRWCWRWTRTARGGRRCCGRSGWRGAEAAAAGGGDARGRGPGGHARRRARRSGCGADRRRRWSCRSSTCGWRSTRPTCRSPAGRDRALDEVVPVLAAMGESISRDELARRGRRPARRRPGRW